MNVAGVTIQSSHVAWELFRGEIHDGVEVCHACDNPSCVNPFHLFLGTHKANMEDMVKKNRQAKGENHGVSKLKEEQVLEIRSSSDKQTVIASRFGITQQTVSDIKIGRRWAWLENISS